MYYLRAEHSEETITLARRCLGTIYNPQGLLMMDNRSIM